MKAEAAKGLEPLITITNQKVVPKKYTDSRTEGGKKKKIRKKE